MIVDPEQTLWDNCQMTHDNINHLGNYALLDDTINYVKAFVYDLCSETPIYSNYKLDMEKIEFWKTECNRLIDHRLELESWRRIDTEAMLTEILYTPINMVHEP